MKQFFMAVGKPQDLFKENVQKLIKRSLQRGYEKFAKQGKWFWILMQQSCVCCTSEIKGLRSVCV